MYPSVVCLKLRIVQLFRVACWNLWLLFTKLPVLAMSRNILIHVATAKLGKLNNILYVGVYAGDPSKLSMKAAFGRVWKLEQIGGSIIGGTIKTIQERNKASKPPRDP